MIAPQPSAIDTMFARDNGLKAKLRRYSNSLESALRLCATKSLACWRSSATDIEPKKSSSAGLGRANPPASIAATRASMSCGWPLKVNVAKRARALAASADSPRDPQIFAHLGLSKLRHTIKSNRVRLERPHYARRHLAVGSDDQAAIPIAQHFPKRISATSIVRSRRSEIEVI